MMVFAIRERIAMSKIDKDINVPYKNDSISRQAAEDIVRFECGEWKGLANTIIKRFKELPSVQPLVLTCDGCRHVGTYDTDFPCSGCIRREKDYYEQER